ncbi:sulfite exporter TauE/SafE family protein [Balneatrix alpica]|uniref:sulfite exporter TauE/SafE family protein n=1 Tax=Balneatrix alpica TaxID=75684 RepID=UPI002738E612|nr:sulfite exporter TauE/SafE family protein [Balneatrix alpica]
MTVLLLYLVLGACAGVLAGLFGIGGGLIIVPALVFTFSAQGVSPDVLTHLAVGTSLATIVVTSLSSVRAHHQRGAVLWPVFTPMALGIALGSIIGVKTAGALTGEHLQKVIGVFALIVAAQMGFGLKPKPSRTLPGQGGLGVAGTGIGWASAIFGIGGGSLSVPFLSWCNVSMQQAVGTSAALGFPIAIFGALANIEQGWQHPALPEWSLGFIYLPALFGIVLTSALFAKVGARLAHQLPAATLKKGFACLLLVIGLKFLF